MAISTYRISKNAGWAKTDVIYQLEEAFDWLGWHGGTVSGIVTGIQSYSGWSSAGGNENYEDVRPSSGGTNIGIGSTCSFYVDRSSGNVNTVYVNRPGAGYADGDSLTVSGADIGGGSDMTVVVSADETGYGSTTTFYDKAVDSNTYPWGVLRLEVEADKVYGDTYWGFQVNGNNLEITSGTGFHPYDETSTYDKGHYQPNSWRGVNYQELSSRMTGTGYGSGSSTVHTYTQREFTISSSNSFQLDLSIFRSALDPNFVVFSYRHPDKSSTWIGGNTYQTFFLHNFTSSPGFDANELYVGSMTEIDRNSSGYLHFRTTLGNNSAAYDYVQSRSALAGYITGDSTSQVDYEIDDYYYGSTILNNISDTYPRFYYRNNDVDASLGIKGVGVSTSTWPNSRSPDSLNYNAVVKGIPLSTNLIPSPYYLPDDFVFISFDYNAPNQNIQQWDTITVSGSEVYTVIDAAYNQTTRTNGIAFCARTT